MKYEFLKMIVQPVILERDAEGRIVGEQTPQPVAVYTREQFNELMDALELDMMSQPNGDVPAEVEDADDD